MPALFESGFCVRTPSWHRQETLLDAHPDSWDDARRLAGLAWDPVSEPVYLRGHSDDTYQPLDGYRRIYRSDTGATLSVMADTYTLIDHAEMGRIVEAILEQPNVKWETAGCLAGGRMVWALAYLDEPIVIARDDSPTYPYFSILNRHDGLGACKVLPTTVRVVCANTFAAAEAEGQRDGTTFAFAHTRHWRDRIVDARLAVTGVRKATAAWQHIANELALMAVTTRQRERFIVEFIPLPPGDVISDRVVANIDTARTTLRRLFDGPTVAPIADNAYGLVQAAGEYLDHLRHHRSAESYLGRQLLRPEALKTRAVRLARQVVTP